MPSSANSRCLAPRRRRRHLRARWPPGHHLHVQFSPELRDKVIAGSITVSFRLWQRPKVRVGGTYAVRDASIQVDDVGVIPFYAISDDDVRRAGETDRESLRKRAAHAGPIHDDTILYRVEFHVV
jgi:hypothetical protein